MNDDMLKALAKNGGVIQINFGSSFVSAPALNWYNKLKEKSSKLEAKHGKDSEQVKEFAANYKTKPFPFADLKIVLDHIDHVVKVAGIDHVGIGSDYDGVGDRCRKG